MSNTTQPGQAEASHNNQRDPLECLNFVEQELHKLKRTLTSRGQLIGLVIVAVITITLAATLGTVLAAMLLPLAVSAMFASLSFVALTQQGRYTAEIRA